MLLSNGNVFIILNLLATDYKSCLLVLQHKTQRINFRAISKTDV